MTALEPLLRAAGFCLRGLLYGPRTLAFADVRAG
jgi:hypothetical protein